MCGKWGDGLEKGATSPRHGAGGAAGRPMLSGARLAPPDYPILSALLTQECLPLRPSPSLTPNERASPPPLPLPPHQVQLDPEQYPGSSGTIVWERARHDLEERESFIVRRAGRLPARATVSLELDHNPQLYLPSPALASLLGLQGLHSLPFVLQMLWGYIKQHNLFEVRMSVSRGGVFFL